MKNNIFIPSLRKDFLSNFWRRIFPGVPNCGIIGTIAGFPVFEIRYER